MALGFRGQTCFPTFCVLLYDHNISNWSNPLYRSCCVLWSGDLRKPCEGVSSRQAWRRTFWSLLCAGLGGLSSQFSEWNHVHSPAKAAVTPEKHLLIPHIRRSLPRLCGMEYCLWGFSWIRLLWKLVVHQILNIAIIIIKGTVAILIDLHSMACCGPGYFKNFIVYVRLDSKWISSTFLMKTTHLITLYIHCYCMQSNICFCFCIPSGNSPMQQKPYKTVFLSF